MAAQSDLRSPSRGHKKKERTRRQLLEAGLRVYAARGDALSVSDVTAEAGVANGTFYNYFPDRETLLDALAAELVLDLAEAAASEPTEDPALRFAIASGRVLQRSTEDHTWGRVVMRLAHRPAVHDNVDRYLRDDLAAGYEAGRFDTGADDATVDQVFGLLLMTIRRIIEDEAGPDTARQALERGLRALGIDRDEAQAISVSALEAPRG